MNALALTIEQLINIQHELNDIKTAQSRKFGLTTLPGLSLGQKRGSGLDFEDLRLYQQGDDVRHIDWNATARLREVYLKLYREERERLTQITVDLRGAMLFGTKHKLKSILACECAAALAWQANRQGDRVGSVVCSETETEANEARASSRGVLDLIGLLAKQHASLLQNFGQKSLNQQSENKSGQNLDTSLALTQKAVSKGGQAFLITGGDDPGETYDLIAGQLAQRRQLVVILVLDPLQTGESSMPGGRYPFRSNGARGFLSFGSHQENKVKVRLGERLDALKQNFGEHNTPVFTISDSSGLRDLITQLVAAGCL